MKAPAYESEPLPIAFRKDQYNADKLNYAHVLPLLDEEKPLSAVLNYLYSDDPKYKQLPNYGELDYIPTGKMYLLWQWPILLLSMCQIHRLSVSECILI